MVLAGPEGAYLQRVAGVNFSTEAARERPEAGGITRAEILYGRAGRKTIGTEAMKNRRPEACFLSEMRVHVQGVEIAIEAIEKRLFRAGVHGDVEDGFSPFHGLGDGRGFSPRPSKAPLPSAKDGPAGFKEHTTCIISCFCVDNDDRTLALVLNVGHLT